MTEQEAYRTLGLSEKAKMDEIKKQYRVLMQRLHPDTFSSSEPSCFSGADLGKVQELSQAYQVLKKKKRKSSHTEFQENKREPAVRYSKWNAPVNPYAYCEREIFCHAEDMDGAILGKFPVARGKYLWTVEEEFSLFLYSLYQASQMLMEEAQNAVPGSENVPIESEFQMSKIVARRLQLQSELVYLLAQQYIDAGVMLPVLAKNEIQKQDFRIFYLPAMLELSAGSLQAEAGETILPARLQSHKLYLKNTQGRELGYLSFLDDRLYYVVIPLLEQRRVQVKLRVKDANVQKKRSSFQGCQKLDLWIRLPQIFSGSLPESLNLQIRDLLIEWKISRYQ